MSRFNDKHPIEFALLSEILGEPQLISTNHVRWGSDLLGNVFVVQISKQWGLRTKTYNEDFPYFFYFSSFDQILELAKERNQMTEKVHPRATPSRYRFEGSEVTVEWRGDDLWAICAGSSCYSKEHNDFEWESRPSSRTEEFLARCRFTLDEAMALVDKAISIWPR